MIVVVTHNFAGTERVSGNMLPRAVTQIYDTSKAGAGVRALLNYHASELNAWYLENWERLELGIGALLLLILFFGAEGTGALMIATGLMLTLVVVEHWFLTPEIVRLGRAAAFQPVQGNSLQEIRFWNFHSAYSILEAMKLGLASFVASKLIFRRRKTTGRTVEIGLTDTTEDGEVRQA